MHRLFGRKINRGEVPHIMVLSLELHIFSLYIRLVGGYIADNNDDISGACGLMHSLVIVGMRHKANFCLETVSIGALITMSIK